MGLVAWMLIVMMMGAGIGRNSDTLELRELGGFQMPQGFQEVSDNHRATFCDF